MTHFQAARARRHFFNADCSSSYQRGRTQTALKCHSTAHNLKFRWSHLSHRNCMKDILTCVFTVSLVKDSEIHSKTRPIFSFIWLFRDTDVLIECFSRAKINHCSKLALRREKEGSIFERQGPIWDVWKIENRLSTFHFKRTEINSNPASMPCWIESMYNSKKLINFSVRERKLFTWEVFYLTAHRGMNAFYSYFISIEKFH